MSKKHIKVIIVPIYLLLTLLLVGCTPSKFFKYNLDDVKKIELYAIEDGDLKLDVQINDNEKIEKILNKLENIVYTRYYGDIKAKSDYIIRIYFDDLTYDEIDPYRILKYKNGKIDKNLKYRCSNESFEMLYAFAKE